MKTISGKEIQAKMFVDLVSRIKALAEKNVFPGLATIMVGKNAGSTIYIANKQLTLKKLGMYGLSFELPESVTQSELLTLIGDLNKNHLIHGVLLQTPLPKHIDEGMVLSSISPKKDVDGFHPLNVGLLSIGNPNLVACTPLGCMKMLESIECDPAGKRAVVLGKSNIVGKPMAMLLINAGATVTICNSKTQNLAEITKSADILIVAIGKEKFITGKMLKPGSVVLDVGINRNKEGGVVGDVDAVSTTDLAGHLSPVPGGVGPMTITMLMCNTVLACEESTK